MNHISFSNSAPYKVAVLVPTASFKKHLLKSHYLEKLVNAGFHEEDIIFFDLDLGGKSKPAVKTITQYLSILLPALQSLSTEYLYVCNGEYFKKLTGQTKTEVNYNYVLPCSVKDHTNFKVVLGVNYSLLFYKPELASTMDSTLNTIWSHYKGTYTPPGMDIKNKVVAVMNSSEAAHSMLKEVMKHDLISLDIEAYSLDYYRAGIGTISFAVSNDKAYSFNVDHSTDSQGNHIKATPRHSNVVRAYLRSFFTDYFKKGGRLLISNAPYDIKVLVYELFMDSLGDVVNMRKWVYKFLDHTDDVQIITYLATNSTGGNSIGLKSNSQSFAGNYAEDVKDITKINTHDLMIYNGVDALATFNTYLEKYPIMVADNQLSVYQTIKHPSLYVTIYMEMFGVPMNKEELEKVDDELQILKNKHLKFITNHPLADEVSKIIQLERIIKDNATLKTKQRTQAEVAHLTFNPSSDNHLRILLYRLLHLPVIKKTKGKQPSTSSSTIDTLRTAHVKDPDVKEFLENLTSYSKVETILTTFISAFKNSSDFKTSPASKEPWLHLFGNYKIGGTVSGRLSANRPNLMNMPSTGTPLAKYTKRIFQAPKGYLIVGADFSSLEDKISALTTKDPQKIKVYSESYDGHSLRAQYYWPHLMPDITEELTVIDKANSVVQVTYEDGTIKYLPADHESLQ